MERRLQLLHYHNPVPRDKRDPYLAARLLAMEGAAIARRSVRTWAAHLAGNLDPPETIAVRARESLRQGLSFPERWILDRINVTGITTDELAAAELREDIEGYYALNEFPMDDRGSYIAGALRALSRRGATTRRIRTADGRDTVYHGVRWHPPDRTATSPPVQGNLVD